MSDEGGKVAKRYGATVPILPLNARKLFLIDKQGVIRAIVDGMPDNQELLRTIDRLDTEA